MFWRGPYYIFEAFKNIKDEINLKRNNSGSFGVKLN